MAYYRFVVRGGEFVLRGERHWQITFNGIQIGGAYATAKDALSAVKRRREGKVVGPVLDGAADPPLDLLMWLGATPRHDVAIQGNAGESIPREHDARTSYRPVDHGHRSNVARAIGFGAPMLALGGMGWQSPQRNNVHRRFKG